MESPERPWVHLILQGKGGVGKSLLAAMLAQHRSERGRRPLCIDTDPVNRTFERFEALDVKGLDMISERQIHAAAFDDMIDLIFAHDRDKEVVVDNGAACFIPLTAYLVDNHVLEFLADNDRPAVIHTVITGGQAFIDTVDGLDHLLRTFDFQARARDLKCVVWLNPYFGPVSYEQRPFETLPAYLDNQDRITACLRLNHRPGLFHDTTRDMLGAHATFQEIHDDTARHLDKPFGIMAKQRLKVIRQELYAQLDHLFQDGLGGAAPRGPATGGCAPQPPDPAAANP